MPLFCRFSLLLFVNHLFVENFIKFLSLNNICREILVSTLFHNVQLQTSNSFVSQILSRELSYLLHIFAMIHL